MQTEVESWSGMVDFACGSGYTVGLDSEGTCHYAGPTSKRYQESFIPTIISWSGVKRIYGGYNYVIGEKNDGTFVQSNLISSPDLSGIENVYYKDNDFLYLEKGGAEISVDYCLENEKTAYMTFFDESSNPVSFKKVILEGNNIRNTQEFTAEGAVSSKVTFNTPSVNEITCYFEHELSANKLSVNYCSAEDKTAYVTLFNESGEVIECKKILLPASENFTTVSKDCREDAVSYKLTMETPTVNDFTFYAEHSFSDGILTINYFGNEDNLAYVTAFNGDGNAIEFKKILLPKSEECRAYSTDFKEGVSSYKLTFNNPSASGLSFYAEHKKEDGKIKINYCADTDRKAFITFFDSAGIPVNYREIILPDSEQMTETESDADMEYKISFDVPLASDISFYLEHKAENREVIINYCSDVERKMWLAFYDEEGSLADFTTVDFQPKEEMTTFKYICERATRYSLYIWDKLKPVYSAEGDLQ